MGRFVYQVSTLMFQGVTSAKNEEILDATLEEEGFGIVLSP